MLGIKKERILFGLLFLICFITCSILAIQLEVSIPINVGLSPEQVIESTYPQIKQENCDYSYKIIGNYIFAYIENPDGSYSFDIGLRNDDSGFTFVLPGIYEASIRDTIFDHNVLLVPLLDDNQIFVDVYKYKTDYAIVIRLYYYHETDFLKNGNKIGKITHVDPERIFWIDVVSDLSEEFEISCEYDGNKIHAVDNEEINALYGVK